MTKYSLQKISGIHKHFKGIFQSYLSYRTERQTMSVYIAGNLIWCPLNARVNGTTTCSIWTKHINASFVHVCIYMGHMQAILQAIQCDLTTLAVVPQREGRVSVVYYTSLIEWNGIHSVQSLDPCSFACKIHWLVGGSLSQYRQVASTLANQSSGNRIGDRFCT